MMMPVKRLASADQLSVIDSIVSQSSFTDGKITAGVINQPLKNNFQLEAGEAAIADELFKVVSKAVETQPLARLAAMPARMTLPIISKYESGMGYEWHIDNAIMPSRGGPIRTDVACTIFLSDPAAYDGGELRIRTTAGENTVKLERGDGFFYPASTRHCVDKVTRGERLAIVFWIQSMIAEPAQREMLYDLQLAHDRVKQENPDSEALQIIQRTQANLIRLWSQF